MNTIAIYTSFKNHKKSGCGRGLNPFLIDLSSCVLFIILQEVGVGRKVSLEAPLTLGHHHNVCFADDTSYFLRTLHKSLCAECNSAVNFDTDFSSR
jgi:hypothetical protein